MPYSDSRGSALVLVLVVITLVVVGSFFVLNAVSSSKVRQAKSGWDETLGSFDEMLARYPATEVNDAALRLERLAGVVGIDLVTRSATERDRPSQELTAAFHRVREPLATYSQRQLESGIRSPLDAPPADGAAFLEEQADAIAAIRDALINGPMPVWESDLSLLAGAPIPNLLGNINLQKLLVADSVYRLYHGDRETALADVEAGWQLARALHHRPALISQLIAIAGARMQAGALRLIPDASEDWVDRLAENEFRESFLTAMKFEGWIWVHMDVFDSSGTFSWLTRPVVAPYNRLCLADTSERYRERIANLADVATLCDADLSQYEADLDIRIPAWNKVGELVVPNLSNAIDRLARLELDMELTRKLVELDAARRANGGAWPTELAGIDHSSACPDDGWLYETGPDGTMSLAFAREISWPNQMGAVLPTRITDRGR